MGPAIWAWLGTAAAHLLREFRKVGRHAKSRIPNADDVRKRRDQAGVWLRWARAKIEYKVDQYFTRGRVRASNHVGVLIAVAIAIGCCGAIAVSKMLQGPAADYFAEAERWETLKNFLIAIGGALIGATAIGFSFIVFAMQVNVERMPHGLFRKFTADFQLMSMFAVTFILVVTVPSLALAPDHSWAATMLVYGIAGTLLVPTLLVLSYRRAIALINPVQQLQHIWRDADRGLKLWGRRATRSIPLMNVQPDPDLETSHDLARTTFFRLYPHWTQSALRSLRYAVAFSRRYAEVGDYEISKSALDTILQVNASYITVKGKTFYTNNPLLVNPFSVDAFFNETLEALRQNVQIAITRGDEQQVGQAFTALASLVRLYLTIDYAAPAAAPPASPHHAQLAAVYLAEAVQAVFPHKMVDVAMQGVRLLGSSAVAILASTQDPTETTSLVDRLAAMGSMGAVDPKFHPVTLEAMKQLANLTVSILRTKSHDSHFAFGSIDGAIATITRLFLASPNGVGMSTHSTYLAPYFSGTSLDGFERSLMDYVNAILAADEKHDGAKAGIENLSEWADEKYRNAKEILLLAIERKSHFAFDIIHWIASVTKLLVAATAAAACDDHHRDEILGHAEWLIATLSWIPETKEATSTGHSYRVHEQFFDVGWEAIHRGVANHRPEFIERCIALLLDWGLRETQFATGWAILEHSIMGCAALALATDTHDSLVQTVRAKLAKIAVKDHELVDRSARNLRRRAKTLRQNPYNLDIIERALEGAPQQEMEALLTDLANVLSPGTKDEPIRARL